MSSHSPAPWSQDPEGEVACTIEDANGKQICYVHIDRNAEGEITEESEANVNLIESAPMMHAALNRKGPGQAPGFTYPMEIFINGELSFKLDTEDATGDLAAIKALMKWRTAKRENRPLTDMELYGTDRPHDGIHRSPRGKTRVVPMSASPATVTQVWELPVDTIKVTLEAVASPPDGCTFKKGDKDPCPTCPRLITCLHSCGLLQDELHEAHGGSPTTSPVTDPPPLFVLERRFKPGTYFEWWGDENGGPYWTEDLSKAEKLTAERAAYEKGMVKYETLVVPYAPASTTPCHPAPEGQG